MTGRSSLASPKGKTREVKEMLRDNAASKAALKTAKSIKKAQDRERNKQQQQSREDNLTAQ